VPPFGRDLHQAALMPVDTQQPQGIQHH
jgi:hypothetical protein